MQILLPESAAFDIYLGGLWLQLLEGPESL